MSNGNLFLVRSCEWNGGLDAQRGLYLPLLSQSNIWRGSGKHRKIRKKVNLRQLNWFQKMMRRICLVVLLIHLGLSLSKSDRKRKVVEEVFDGLEHDEEVEHVVMRYQLDGLQYPPASVSRKSIIANESTVDFGERHFKQPVLAYVTPWNNRGYDLAKWASHKFTHISPVWLQLKPQSADMAESCRILGTHDIDHGWLTDVRKNNSEVMVVPRVLFDDWPLENMANFLNNESWKKRCLDDLLDFLQRNHFNGAVIELWTNAMMTTHGHAAPYLIEMLNSWGHEFHDRHMEIIVPVGYPLDAKNEPTGVFNAALLQKIAGSVDYVQIMTYNFPGSGGVAPYIWIEKCIQSVVEGVPLLASKLMIGINHYGYSYSSKGAEPVIREQFLEKLSRQDAELEWDDEVAEHRLTTKDSILFYPSLTSIELRLRLANKYGIGIGIWDLGQGLNYFSKLL